MFARRLIVVLAGFGALFALSTIRVTSPEVVPPPKPKRSPNAFSFDPESGETRASATTEDGAVVRLHSGQKVPLRIPAGFMLFPGAEVLEHHRVERGEGSRTLLVMATDRSIAEIAEYYRAQAETAEVAIDVEIVTPEATTLAGRSSNGLDFSFTARREDGRTRAQLSVGQGL